MTSRRLLVVNADDFGFTADVNAGIVEAFRTGILTSTTLMANGPAFEDAVRLAKEFRDLDVGCHLVLVGGRSVLPPHKPLPGSVPELIAGMLSRSLRVYDELAQQVKLIVDSGIEPTHLDTHKHTHLLSPVLDAVARVAQEFGIRWVRRPFDLPLTAPAAGIPWMRRATSGGLQFLRARFHRVLESRGCSMTDHFAGFQMTGNYGAKELEALIRALPLGLTEFMCHPGTCGDELRAANTRLKQSREQELRALTDPGVLAAVKSAGVELLSFRDLILSEPVLA